VIAEPDEEPLLEQVSALAELGLLTTSLLHEIRQPLFAVKGRIELTRHQGKVLQGSDLLALLEPLRHVQELLDHYAGYGRQEPTARPFDARGPLQHALGMLAHRARQEGADLVSSLGEAPVEVMGRPVALRQVAVNLLQNALDAVADRAERRVTLRVGVQGQAAVIEVLDTGGGVPEALGDRVFDAFVSTNTTGRGTGLGLYIARRLVTEAGGTLVLAPHAPGTRAMLTWPLVNAPAAGSESSATPPSRQ